MMMGRVAAVALPLVLVAMCLSLVVSAQSVAPTVPFQPTGNVTGFDEGIARRHLYHSYAAYCPTAILQKWSCKYCAGSVRFIDTVYDAKTNTFVYIAYDVTNDEVIVSYRGTEPLSLTNWIENIKFWKTDTDFDGLAGAKVAKGFFECFKVLSGGVVRAVRNALAAYTTASIVITGHSLGGAMATMAALDFKVMVGIVPRALFTYGSPRVGNTGFYNQFSAQMSQSPHWRMVNDRDIVPHLPPYSFDFHHTTTEIWEKKANYKVCDNSGEDKSCAWGVILPILPDSIVDHLNYMQLSGGLCFGSAGEVLSNAEPTAQRNILTDEETKALYASFASNTATPTPTPTSTPTPAPAPTVPAQVVRMLRTIASPQVLRA